MSATARPEPSDLTREVAAIITGLLARRGREQRELAEAMGISRAQTSRMLNGQKHWDIDQLSAACRFLGADWVEVLTDAERTVAARTDVRPVDEDADLGRQDHYARAARTRATDRGEDID